MNFLNHEPLYHHYKIKENSLRVTFAKNQVFEEKESRFPS